MFLTVKKTAQLLGLNIHQVYYLVTMCYIEAIKIGDLWRIAPESVEAYKARLEARAQTKNKAKLAA